MKGGQGMGVGEGRQPESGENHLKEMMTCRSD